jgi:hypothetical protein
MSPEPSARTSSGAPLFIEISDEGFKFYVTESSSGVSHDKPITRSIDDLWDWIKDDGDRVKLKNRASVKRAEAKSRGT